LEEELGGCGRPFVFAVIFGFDASGPDPSTALRADCRRYRTTPSRGELAVAYNFLGMRPER
jgi:hypothetical protein